MSRITSHTIGNAPEASRPLLQDVVQFSPTGRLLGPTVYTGYFLNYAKTGNDLPA